MQSIIDLARHRSRDSDTAEQVSASANAACSIYTLRRIKSGKDLAQTPIKTKLLIPKDDNYDVIKERYQRNASLLSQ